MKVGQLNVYRTGTSQDAIFTCSMSLDGKSKVEPHGDCLNGQIIVRTKDGHGYELKPCPVCNGGTK